MSADVSARTSGADVTSGRTADSGQRTDIVRRACGQGARLRWELLPVSASVPYTALIEAQAYGGTAPGTTLAYASVTAASLAVTGVSVHKGLADTAVAGGVVSVAAAWATWQSHAGPSVAGVVVAGMGTALSAIPYWRWLSARRDGHRAEDIRLETARFKLEQARLKSGGRGGGGGGSEIVDAEIVGPFPWDGPHPDPWPGPSGVGRADDPIPIGQGVALPMRGGHIKIGGVTGGGKSCLVHVIACELLSRPNTRVMGIDCKPGAPALGRYRWAGMRVVTTAEDADALLSGVEELMHRRGATIEDLTRGAVESDDGELPPETWVPTPEEPWTTVIVDEVTALTGTRAAETLDKLVRMSRSYGVTLVVATQSLDAAVFAVGRRSGGGSRAQYATSVCMTVTTDAEAEKVLGTGCVKEGWNPRRLPPGGFMLVRGSGDLAVPRMRLGWYVDEARTLAHVRELYALRGGRGAPVELEEPVGAPSKSYAEAPSKPPSGTQEERVRAAVGSAGGQWVKARDIAAASGMANDGTLRSVLSRLRRAGAVESDGSGSYRPVSDGGKVVRGPWEGS